MSISNIPILQIKLFRFQNIESRRAKLKWVRGIVSLWGALKERSGVVEFAYFYYICVIVIYANLILRRCLCEKVKNYDRFGIFCNECNQRLFPPSWIIHLQYHLWFIYLIYNTWNIYLQLSLLLFQLERIEEKFNASTKFFERNLDAVAKLREFQPWKWEKDWVEQRMRSFKHFNSTVNNKVSSLIK